MRTVRFFWCLPTVLLLLFATATATSAQSHAQEIADLTREVLSSNAMQVLHYYDFYGQGRCATLDPTVRDQALADFNAFEQRAVSLADASSGIEHARAMALVRAIDSSFYTVMYRQMPDTCYVAPADAV